MRLYIWLTLFYLIVWAGGVIAVAVKFENWPFAAGSFLAWVLSYAIIKWGERGMLLGLGGIYRFLVKHARVASLLLFLVSYIVCLGYVLSPDIVQQEIAASGSSEFVFWLKAGLGTGLLGGHCFFLMTFWLLDRGALGPIRS